MTTKPISSKEIAKKVVEILYKRKAEDIEALHVGDLTVIADYFVLAKAGNNTHAKSMIGEIEDELEKYGVTPLARDGYNSSSWVVIDLNGVMVHVFFQKEGDFYADALKSIWADAESINILE